MVSEMGILTEICLFTLNQTHVITWRHQCICLSGEQVGITEQPFQGKWDVQAPGAVWYNGNPIWAQDLALNPALPW